MVYRLPIRASLSVALRPQRSLLCEPMIIQRKRTELIFGYGHKFEAYVPKAKRVFGYFALPVLVDDEIVAALDLKTDRQNRKLLMQKWNWVGPGKAAKGEARKALKRRIEEELDRFETFQLADASPPETT